MLMVPLTWHPLTLGIGGGVLVAGHDFWLAAAGG